MSWKSLVVKHAFLPCFRMLAALSVRERKGLRVLILPPTTPGSLGDEAMMRATIDSLRDDPAVTEICVLNIFSHEALFTSMGAEKELCLPSYGESALRFVLQNRKELQNWDILLTIGADILDGAYSVDRSVFYLELASSIADMGIRSRILGFSFNSNPDVRIVEVVKRLSTRTELCPRDPLSFQRIADTGTSARLQLVADAAFMLAPDGRKIPSDFRFWIESRRLKGHRLLGLNLSSHTLSSMVKRFDGNYKKVIKVVSEAIVELTKFQPLSIVLLPHDSRWHKYTPSDVEVCEILCAELYVLGVDVFSRQIAFDAASVKAVCAEMDLVVTGRMHVAIGSLSVGVPVVSMTYQDKFEGLYQLFGMDGLTLNGDTCFENGDFIEVIKNVLFCSNELRERVATALTDVKMKSSLNFKFD